MNHAQAARASIIVVPITTRRACRHCPEPRRVATHAVESGGVRITTGCQWHAYEERREMINLLRFMEVRHAR